MVLPILVLPTLVLPTAQWHGFDSARPVERHRPVDLYKTKRRLAAGPRWRAMSRQRHRSLLQGHWTRTATTCAPLPLPPLVAECRTNVGCRNVLARCEALLRQLLRRRRDTMNLARSDLVHVAAAFDSHTLRAPVRSVAVNAFVLASMYWNGC